MCQNYILIYVENNYIHKSIAITLNNEHAGASKPFIVYVSDNVPKATTQQFKCGPPRRRRRCQAAGQSPFGPSHNTR